MSSYDKSEPASVQKMFDSVAPNYDRMNAILSFGLYRYWNYAFVKQLGKQKKLLDLCAGTGDIAFSFLKRNSTSQATLLDFSSQMLAFAKMKADPCFKVSYLEADACSIPLEDASFPSVTISYGIRNIPNPSLCFKEVFRILEPGGRFSILELSRPSLPLSWGHSLYLKTALPLLGKWVAQNEQAYQYLCDTVQGFASPDSLKQQLVSQGFDNISIKPLSLGIATIISADKPLH